MESKTESDWLQMELDRQLDNQQLHLQKPSTPTPLTSNVGNSATPTKKEKPITWSHITSPSESADEWSGGDSNSSAHQRNVERQNGRQWAAHLDRGDDSSEDEQQDAVTTHSNQRSQQEWDTQKVVYPSHQTVVIPKLGGA